MYTKMIPLIIAMSAVAAARADVAAPSDLQRCISAAAERASFSGSITVSQGEHSLAHVYRDNLAGPDSPPIDSRTRFNLGSASKMFTAVAIGQLIDRGKLRLDQPVGELVGGLTPEASQVTIRQLLNHTSGLGDFFRPENMDVMLKARSASDILPLIAQDQPAFPPGSRFSYSNSGFALLGIVVERLSGMTYAEYLKRYIFARAGMLQTGPDPQPLATLAVGMTSGHMVLRPPSDAKPELIPPGGLPTPAGAEPSSPALRPMLIGPDGRPVDPSTGQSQELRPAPGAAVSYGSPAGGLYSTGDDMQRFAVALTSGKLLSSATLAAFASPQVEASPATAEHPARHYGFGFGIVDEGQRQWVGHGGGTLGANSEYYFERNDGWIVSVLSNRDPPMATNLMHEVRQMLENPASQASCR